MRASLMYLAHLLVSLALCGTALGAPSVEQLQRSASPAAETVHKAWEPFWADLSAVQVDGTSALADALAPFQRYAFTLTPSQLQRAYTNRVQGPRLRRLVRRHLLAHGHALKIGVIGTSVSWGTGPSARGTTDYVSMLPTALQLTFPNASATSRNGCSPGTGSGFANMCLTHMLDEDVHLLVMEFVTNDFIEDRLWNNSHTVTYERLVRKALNMKSQPAVVFLQVPTWGQTFNATRDGHKRFHQSAELLYSPLAQYYGLPVLSFRNAWYHEAEQSSPLAPQGWDTLTTVDQVHPNDIGHRSMLDMLVWMLLQTVIDLHVMPMTRRELLGLTQTLPEPMHAGNYEESVSLCLLEDQLRSVVNESLSQDWSLVNEGTHEKKKIGYVSTTPGSTLHVTFDLGSVLGHPTTYEKCGGRCEVGIAIAYLQSYTHMGQASWTCVEGCECDSRVFDAHHTQKTSTSYMALMRTRATAPLCRVHITVLHNTSSDGHKFKVSALMVSRYDGMGFSWPTDRSAEWALIDLLKAP